jgi:hypothetical protein
MASALLRRVRALEEAVQPRSRWFMAHKFEPDEFRDEQLDYLRSAFGYDAECDNVVWLKKFGPRNPRYRSTRISLCGFVSMNAPPELGPSTLLMGDDELQSNCPVWT